MRKNGQEKLRIFDDLAGTSIDDFFSHYWQKQPLLARQAIPNFSSPLDAGEIAGLCIEDDVTSRLVVHNKDQWHVTHGPIASETFSKLPDSNWTLLVQHADNLDPKVNELLDKFRFIPNWRLDDIMVSYAVNGGGVGPHFDYYDVFLLQAEGQRRWRLGQQCHANSPLLPNQAMKILESFDSKSDYVLSAGDLLYVPARTAHWGEAIGECITYSIGFRAPSYADFMLDYSQELASHYDEDQRYTDPDLNEMEHPGLISPAVLSKFENIFLSMGKDKQGLGRWLGQYSTQLNHDISGMYQEATLQDLREDTPCIIHPHARVAFVKEESDCICFVNGAAAKCSEQLAVVLSEKQAFCFSHFRDIDRNVLEDLVLSKLILPETAIKP